jgi:hypothetical protein
VCKRRVRHAGLLEAHFPFLGDLVVAGWISWAHVEVILTATNPRITAEMVAACPMFVRWANDDPTDRGLKGRFDRWAQRVRDRARLLDTEGGYDPNDDLHANRLRITEHLDGTRELTGRLVGAAAVTIEEALEQLSAEIRDAWQAAANLNPDITVPGEWTLNAMALEEACRRAMGRPAGSTQPPRVEATLVIRAGNDGHAKVTTLAGTPVPTSAADALLWDADVRALLLDSNDNPLFMGRKVRLATREQRIAIAIRDGGCIFPGCDARPSSVQIHHDPPWEHGGTTDIDTLNSYCRSTHHGIRHRHGWDQHPDPDRPQHWIITTPTGRQLRTERNPPPDLQT